LNTATLALAAIKSGNMGMSGATGAVLDRSLVGLRSLIDRSLAEVRVGAGMTLHRSVFMLANFIGEVKYSAVLEADLLDCVLRFAAQGRYGGKRERAVGQALVGTSANLH
jgi:hypothetical protein